MKIFVTGATGFIGAHFVSVAMCQGHQVVAHRRSAKRPTCIPFELDPQWVVGPMEEIAVKDFLGCEALVHLAASGVSPKPATWNTCMDFNVGATLNLIQTAMNAGLKRMVVAGTYAEYGRAGLRFDLIPPDAPLEPTDAYAASKAAAGIMLSALARQQRLELFYGRIFSAYGEGQAEVNFWPQLRTAALAGEDFEMTMGAQVRDFIRVEEVAKIFLAACLRTDLIPGEPMVSNVASGIPVTLAEFAQQMWSEWNARGNLRLGALPYRENEVMRYIPLLPTV